MSRRYYLGLNARGLSISEGLWTLGSEKDAEALEEFLCKKYGKNGSNDNDNSGNNRGSGKSVGARLSGKMDNEAGAEAQAILCKNGRSALTLALKAYFDRGDTVAVNGFTCYAVYEAVKAAGLKPVFADIDMRNLNFSVENLKSLSGLKGIIVQNSLGNPVNMAEIEKFAKKNGLVIIEDLAHCAGIKYPDGREAGTVGAAAVFSFGKDKSINTVSGGAVVLRDPCPHAIKAPSEFPQISDILRARLYPSFCAACRTLNYIHLGGVRMRFLQRIHWVEKSADSKLDVTRKLPNYQAKLALRQFKSLNPAGEAPIREFYLVRHRSEVLNKLRAAGYYFDALWYEKPVSPERYYAKVGFDEEACPVATAVAAQIINFPTYYTRGELKRAREIIRPYLMKGGRDE